MARSAAEADLEQDPVVHLEQGRQVVLADLWELYSPEWLAVIAES